MNWSSSAKRPGDGMPDMHTATLLCEADRRLNRQIALFVPATVLDLTAEILLLKNIMTMTRRGAWGVLLMALLASAMSITAAAAESLFVRLGGTEKITAAADEIVTSVSQDSRTRRTFDGVALAPLKRSVATHLSSITGGPAIYHGDTMALAHTGLQLTDEEFDVMGEYVEAAFLHQGAAQADRKELATLLESMRSEVVGK